jgi:transcriptional regulator with XRE-family HTH domain
MSRPKSELPFSQPTTTTISARIRAHRKARSLTLSDIERLSNGSIKAVVMGSYERGMRAISLVRAIELADLFEMPISELLGDPTRPNYAELPFQRFDLRQVGRLTDSVQDQKVMQLHNYLAAIAQRRGDWNGEILTLRATDLDTLTLLMEMGRSQLFNWLSEWKITLQ